VSVHRLRTGYIKLAAIASPSILPSPTFIFPVLSSVRLPRNDMEERRGVKAAEIYAKSASLSFNHILLADVGCFSELYILNRGYASW
jgi:hypothetical protein